jgi:hypothetical protein
MSFIGGMTHLLAHHPIVTWLELRMTHAQPLPSDRVRLVGVLVLDPTLTDSDSSARASWIADGTSLRELLAECGDELGRYDAVAAVTWPADRPEVSLVIVNP